MYAYIVQSESHNQKPYVQHACALHLVVRVKVHLLHTKVSGNQNRGFYTHTSTMQETVGPYFVFHIL